jgi:uncharacterized membrane-anchored protein
MTKTFAPWRALILAAAALSVSAVAQESEQTESGLTPEQQAYMAEARRIWESLTPRTGEIVLPGGFATLDVPDTYYYLDPADTSTVLEDVWGNPPGSATLGMLMPEKYTPFDSASWAVTIEYVEDGYVSDADAAEINYDKLLKQMQKDTRQSSKARAEAGYGTVDLVGWAEPPFYSTEDKHMYWAKELLFNGEDRTLNYDIRALGRKGVLSMTFIAGADQLGEINAARDEILQMAAFNQGFRYEDYNPDTDKLAAYGLGALVAGAVAKKTGLLVAALVFLKKFGVFILVGIAALFGKIKGMFTGKQA